MAVPAFLPTVSEQHTRTANTVSPTTSSSATTTSSSVQSETESAVVGADVIGSVSVVSVSSKCCPSIDSCLVRLEVAFMTRSEEKHQQLAARVILPLINSHHSPAVCPVCRDRDKDGQREAEKDVGADETDESRLSGGELDRDNTDAAATAAAAGMDSVSDGTSRHSWMDSVSGDDTATATITQTDHPQLHSHSPPPRQQHQSSEACFYCRWRACQSSSLPAVQCVESVVQIVTRVELAKALEGPVKAFQRHNTTGQPFREDVSRIIELLCNADQADMDRLDNILPDTTTHTNSDNHHLHSSEHKQHQLQQRYVKGDVEECKEAEDGTLYDVDEGTHTASQPHQQQLQHESIKPRGCPVLPVGLSSLSSSRSRRAVLAVTLLCCKFATENAPFNLKKSEIVKRKVRGLRLLLHLLQRAPHAYRCTRSGVMLLRRFVCPSLLTACITDVPVVFRLVLTIFRHLYDAAYRCHLLIELGTLVDMMFLPLLESTHCTIQQKRDIVDTIAHCCGSSQQVVALFYSYDNRVPTWPIFERCVAVVAKLCEGDIKYAKQHTGGSSSRYATLEQPINNQSGAQQQINSKPAAAAVSSSSLNPPSTGAPSSPSSSASSSADTSDDSSHIEALRKHCLRLLVSLLEMQAQWLGLPGVQRPHDGLNFPPPAAIPANTPINQSDATRLSNSATSSNNTTRTSTGSVDIHVTPPSPAAYHTVLNTANVATSATAATTSTTAPSELESALVIHEKRMRAAARNSTWMSRVDQQKADADIERKILKLAHNDGLSKAVRELRVLYPQSAWPQEIAHFLHRHESKLDKAEVGELLSGLSDSLLSQPEYESLRDHFLALLDFCGLSFEAALRVFLTSSGFRLPGEAQKIDRMLATFCRAYVKDNAGVFPNADAAFILAFALVMLNTDQHNASMKGRQPMTEQQFISNLRGVNNG